MIIEHLKNYLNTYVMKDWKATGIIINHYFFLSPFPWNCTCFCIFLITMQLSLFISCHCMFYCYHFRSGPKGSQHCTWKASSKVDFPVPMIPSTKKVNGLCGLFNRSRPGNWIWSRAASKLDLVKWMKWGWDLLITILMKALVTHDIHTHNIVIKRYSVFQGFS